MVSMRRAFLALPLMAACTFTGCGYHTLGAATHLPPGASTLAVPVFATRTDACHSEVALTQAVLRELATRTRLRIQPDLHGDPDLVLRGTILQEAATPLTYNSQSEAASSYLLTLVAAVSLTDRTGRVLYENKNYVFREQFQSSTDLAREIDENPAAMNRLSRAFASQLVADLLESF